MCQKIGGMKNDKFIVELINEVIDKDGIIRDDASVHLFQIRNNLSENRRQSDRIYKTHIERLRRNGQLSDIEENFINGRRVLGVLAEYKREIKGIILGQSASGKICYIEPQNLIELNNERLEWIEEEQKEIYKILKTLTEKLRPNLTNINQYFKLLVDFDMLHSKSFLAKLLKANKPYIVEHTQKLNLINAFHPELFFQNKEKEIETIPFNCFFDESNRIMVISGPNAGGKSITLKTIGLLQIMFQCGLFVTTHPKSEFCIMENLLGDIGDNQSIEDGLSTYSSRLFKMNYFLKNIHSKSLFMIDEFGTGSDPDMGGALAEVILNRLNEKQAIGVITTHFTNLKLLANHQSGIFNACMLFNNKTLKPLYQLQVGEPGSSFTFEVAYKTGLSHEIIEEAKTKLSREKVKMDKLLNELQQEKNKLMKLKKDIQKQMSKTTAAKREYFELNEQLETSLQKHQENKIEKQKLMDYGKKLHQLTEEWLETKNKKEVIHKFVKLAGYEYAKKKALEEYEKTVEFKNKKIKQVRNKIAVGSKVKMLRSKEIGVVKSLKDERAIIILGNVEFNVGLEKLELVSS